MIKYDLKHHYQPTNRSCSQASLAMLFSYYGKSMMPEEIIEKVPVLKDDKGEDWGTINQQLAAWCLELGFDVTMYTADFQVIDLSWEQLPKDRLLERMEAVKDKRNVPGLGKTSSQMYVQSYIDFVKAGGELHIRPYIASKLIDGLLPTGPVLACVCFNVLYDVGRTRAVGLRETVPDDTEGALSNHTIVIRGKDDDGNYLIADPWEKPGFHAVEPERLLAGMAASQMECDNLLFQLALKQGKK